MCPQDEAAIVANDATIKDMEVRFSNLSYSGFRLLFVREVSIIVGDTCVNLELILFLKTYEHKWSTFY